MKIRELNSLLQDRKSLMATLILSVLYVLPLMIANYDYLDDIGRNLFGYGWQHDGRFIATILGKLWSLNSTIVSVYPYSLLLSALILGFSGYILTSLWGLEDKKLIKWSSLFIVTAPVYLGNLVFKFDCLPMSLSLMAVVLPFVFYGLRLKFFVASAAGIYTALGLFQSSATVYFIIAAVFLIQELIKYDWKTFFEKLIAVSLAFVIAFACYMVSLKILRLDISNRAAFIFSEDDIIGKLAYNNSRFFDQLSLVVRSGYYRYYAGFFLLLSLLGFAYFMYSKRDKPRHLLVVPLILCAAAISFWLISGVNIFLLETYWDLRTFCGLGFFLMFCAYFHKYLKMPLLQKISRFSMALLVFFSFVLMAQFGKSLTYQTQFENDFLAEIKPYLSEKPLKNFGMIGTMPLAPKNHFTYSVFPIFSNLQGGPVGQFSTFAKHSMNMNGTLDGVEQIETWEFVCKGDLVKHLRYCNIRRIGEDTLILDFNKNECGKEVTNGKE